MEDEKREAVEIIAGAICLEVVRRDSGNVRKDVDDVLREIGAMIVGDMSSGKWVNGEWVLREEMRHGWKGLSGGV